MDTRGIVFYTDNRLNSEIAKWVQDNLKKISDEKKIPIISVSLAPINLGTDYILSLEPSYQTMFEQILLGIKVSKCDTIFFCEHDVLYHPTHFDFVPTKSDLYYYNTNVWKADWYTGKAVRVNDCKQTSGLCASRDLLLQHYTKRVELVKSGGFSRAMGFEPGTHGRKERVDDYKAEGWESRLPNVDIRHKKNLTRTRWSPDEFRNKRFAEGWTESMIDRIPGWDIDRRNKWIRYSSS